MDYLVRDAEPRDVDSVLAAFKRVNGLHVQLHPDFYRAVEQVAPKYELQVAVHSVGQHVATALNGPFAIKIAERDGESVGCVFARTQVRGARDWIKHDKWAYLDNVAVNADAPFQEVGEALVLSVKDWAKAQGLAAVEANVACNNNEERALYERMGLGVMRHNMWGEV